VDQLQFFLECFGSIQAFFGTIHPINDILFLAVDPVPQIGVDQGFQVLGVQLVVVDQGGKAILQPIPDMPDKGPVLEQLAVLDEKFIPEPGFQGLAGMICIF